MWETFKTNFAVWERATSQFTEKVLQNPGVLAPTGAMFSAAMKTKAAADRALDMWWSAWGLPTRRDQVRLLHKMNQLESRLMDFEQSELHRESE